MNTIYQAVADVVEKNQLAALCTVVRSQGSTPRRAASKMLVYSDGRILGSVGGGEMESRVIAEARQAILDGRPRLVEYSMSDPERGDPGVCGGQMEIFVEPIQPKPTLLIFGAGHVGRAVAHLAHWLGFRVVAFDDRPEYCTPETFPEADEHYPGLIEEIGAQIKITPWTYIVLTTRSVDVDVQILPTLLPSSAAYLGVIGSRRRWATTCQKLIDLGISQGELSRVHSPMGLKLKAETPEEIAVSIMAEIILLRHSDSGS
jgi:xanthine dehydrogenase accessory factor